MWRPALPTQGMFATWRDDLVSKLRTLSFHHFPARIPAAQAADSSQTVQVETEPGITVPLRKIQSGTGSSGRVWLVVADSADPEPSWWQSCASQQDTVYLLEPRGIGATRWTRKNPPNYVERAHYLLGRTVDSGRVWDIAATARFLHSQGQETVCVGGSGAGGVLSAYAALLEPEIAELFLFHPQHSHMEDSAPAILNVLRVCDIPDVVGMLAPRSTTIVSDSPDFRQVTARIFQLAGAPEKLSLKTQ